MVNELMLQALFAYTIYACLIAFRGRIPRALLRLPYWSVYCCCNRFLEAPNASHNVLPAKTV